MFANQTVKRLENHLGVLNLTLRFQVFLAKFVKQGIDIYVIVS